MVYLVGAGPGDAGLLTLRGAEVLRRAEVVVYDALVTPDLLRLAPAPAERIGSGEPPADERRSPADLSALLVARAKAGKVVVRLKAGDPCAAGPGGTEAGSLAAAGVAFEIVPGVSSSAAVVNRGATRNGFEHGPLFGQRVVVTRARDQAAEFVGALAGRGADVLEIPVIRIEAATEHAPLAEAMAGLNAYDWLVFTSANGVTRFFDLFFRAFPDLRDIGGVRIAAVGPATAAKLRELHLNVDVMPERYVAAEVAKALAGFESLENRRILLLRAQEATADLPRLLEERGAIVDDIACYRTVAETGDESGGGAKLLEAGADWVTFTSGSTVQHFHARFDLPKLLAQFPRMKMASIGPETTKALADLGLKPTLEAKPHTLEALLRALERRVGGTA